MDNFMKMYTEKVKNGKGEHLLKMNLKYLNIP